MQKNKDKSEVDDNAAHSHIEHENPIARSKAREELQKEIDIAMKGKSNEKTKKR